MAGDGKGLVTIFGGSGFVGRYTTRALARAGYRVRAAVRRPDLAGHLQPLGAVGQIHAVQANLRDDASVARAVEGAVAVVNCVGILQESGKQTFKAVQAEGAARVARAAAAAHITRFVHVSAIGADARSAAQYARTKAEAEDAVLSAIPTAVILRPSIVFGPEDQFFNRFASMAQMAPVLPLIGGGRTLFQPVYVGDVADAIAAAIEGKAKPGTIYELGGPEVVSFRDLLDRMQTMINRNRGYVNLPFWAAKIQATLLKLSPIKPITLDQVRMLESDNVVSQAAIADGRTLAGLGITSPVAIDAIVPEYLTRFRPKGQFSRYRG